MRAEFFEPFVEGSFRVLREVLSAEPERGPLSLRSGKTFTTQELTTLIGVNGDVEGVVLFAMSLNSALKIASQMMGEAVTEFDEMAASAINELGNMITGNATTALEQNGFQCDITPPSLIQGIGNQITTTTPALLVPVSTRYGDIEMNLALAESVKSRARAA